MSEDDTTRAQRDRDRLLQIRAQRLYSVPGVWHVEYFFDEKGDRRWLIKVSPCVDTDKLRQDRPHILNNVFIVKEHPVVWQNE